MKVVHLTAHLGGGVGKALSGLAAHSDRSIERTIVCLARPEKTQFIDRLREIGTQVIVCPSAETQVRLVEDADIVQLEWWNHPETFACLCSLPNPPLRLLVWCHVSGLFNPIIPRGLIGASRTFVFTSACSYEATEVRELDPELRERLTVVSSCGGFEGLPEPQFAPSTRFSVGYIGSLNFAKLHPHYVEFLAAVDIPGFCVSMVGDSINQDVLSAQCDSMGKSGMLKFLGYTSDVATALRQFDVLAYLLNPTHYGTTENALLEAMSMGVVPVVLDNPAERSIVDDRRTGLIVRSPGEFAQAVGWLWRNPTERRRIGERAAQQVREKYSVEKTGKSFDSLYRAMPLEKKATVDFRKIFGDDPADWFLACQGDRTIFREDGSLAMDLSSLLVHGLFERSKGSVFHFQKYFPDNPRLAEWKRHLERLQ